MQKIVDINTKRPLQDEYGASESEENTDRNKNKQRAGKGEEGEIHVKVGNGVNSTDDDENYSDVADCLLLHFSFLQVSSRKSLNIWWILLYSQ